MAPEGKVKEILLLYIIMTLLNQTPYLLLSFLWQYIQLNPDISFDGFFSSYLGYVMLCIFFYILFQLFLPISTTKNPWQAAKNTFKY